MLMVIKPEAGEERSSSTERIKSRRDVLRVGPRKIFNWVSKKKYFKTFFKSLSKKFLIFFTQEKFPGIIRISPQ